MLRRLRPLVLVLATLCGAAACASSTGPEDALAVVTTTSQFARDTLGYVRVTFRVSNASGTPVYLPTCGGVVTATLDQRAGDVAWLATASYAFCLSSYAVGPYRLDPGQTVQGEQTARLTVGAYRVSVPVALSPTSTPSRTARSGQFAVL